jgi:hypothetical protein
LTYNSVRDFTACWARNGETLVYVTAIDAGFSETSLVSRRIDNPDVVFLTDHTSDLDEATVGPEPAIGDEHVEMGMPVGQGAVGLDR